MSFQTADLCDIHEDKLRILTPMFHSYGGRTVFHGPVTTLKLFEDNGLVRQAVEQPGGGRVLVIDGGGSLRRALVGDQLAKLAEKNGWAGILVYGCIRDSAAISQMNIGVFAMATCPLKTVKRNQGEIDVPVTFGGTTIAPCDWLYADMDGVVVSAIQLG